MANTTITPNQGSLALTGIAAGVAINAPVALKVLTAYGLGVGASTNIGAVSLQALTATGVGQGLGWAVGAASLQYLTATGAGPYVSINALKPLTASGRQGNVAIGALTLNRVEVRNPAGYIKLEKLLVYAQAFETPSQVFTTKAMNTRSGAISEYSGYPFNSFAFFRGDYLAAGDGGLYILAGDTDAGTTIDWEFTSGQLDDKQPGLKRLPEILCGLRADEAVRVRVWCSDTEYYDYTLPATKIDTIRQQRVTPGKGMRSRWFKVGLSSINGGKMKLDSMQINMTKTTRRVG